jgi:hypothetical protein
MAGAAVDERRQIKLTHAAELPDRRPTATGTQDHDGERSFKHLRREARVYGGVAHLRQDPRAGFSGICGGYAS